MRSQIKLPGAVHVIRADFALAVGRTAAGPLISRLAAAGDGADAAGEPQQAVPAALAPFGPDALALRKPP
jgi:hypothetical protein